MSTIDVINVKIQVQKGHMTCLKSYFSSVSEPEVEAESPNLQSKDLVGFVLCLDFHL